MDRPEAAEPGSSGSGHVSPFQVRRRRCGEEDTGEPTEEIKRIKLEGITTSNIKSRDENITENLKHQKEEERTSQTTDATASILSDKLLPTPMDLNSPAEISGGDAPYKKLGQMRCAAAASECGSTAGQVEVSESMRKWNEMKQNGFLSSVQVKAPPIPRPKRRNSRKKNDEEIEKMIGAAKRELTKHGGAANPGQLLSGLNPGIIKHVRNSKQVSSIIKAMLQNEMAGKQASCPAKKGGQEAINKPLISCCRNSERFSDSDMRENNPEFNSEFDDDDDDALRLKLSSSVTIAPEQGGKTADGGFSRNQGDITSLSVKGDVLLYFVYFQEICTLSPKENPHLAVPS